MKTEPSPTLTMTLRLTGGQVALDPTTLAALMRLAQPPVYLTFQGELYSLEALDPLPGEVRAWLVRKAGVTEGYAVTEDMNGKQSCLCKGFQYRKACRHIRGLMDLRLLSRPKGVADAAHDQRQWAGQGSADGGGSGTGITPGSQHVP